MYKSLLTGAAFAVCFAFTGAAEAAGYLKIDGIDGESRAAGKDKWIDIETVSEEIARPSASAGSARARSAAQFSDIVVSKSFDVSSVPLREAMVQGRVLKKITIEVSPEGARSSRSPGLSYKIELDNAVITGLSYSADDEGLGTEEITFSYEKITWTYNKPDASGAKNDPKTATYDLRSGR